MSQRRPELQLDFHLLGQVGFDALQALQRRIAYQVASRPEVTATVLLCEHPPLITVGRSGSRGHVRLTSEELRRKRLQIRWVRRGGGCILHGPGQLAIYVVSSLERWEISVGDFARRLRAALQGTLTDLQAPGTYLDDDYRLFGRTGLLASVALAVRFGVTNFGAVLNVSPQMRDQAFIAITPPVPDTARAQTSCLLAERRQAATMPRVRSVLLPQLAAQFAVEQYAIHAGHPLLAALNSPVSDSSVPW